MSPKFASYKQEILEHLNIEHYQLAMTKSNEYIKTNKVKSIKPNEFCYYARYKVFNYGISKRDSLKLYHVLSSILYCDYSKYCTKFSSTFRALTRTESMEQTKLRNAGYY